MISWRDWPILCINKADFPDQLKKAINCPNKLYYRGEWNLQLFKNCLAIVGSRRMTRYGRVVINKLMPEIVADGNTVVSGFMYGVDSYAHNLCLGLGGKTIAVLGCGLNYLTPTENDEMYTNILNEKGLVISEYENDFKPTLWSFPQRNRIVAALANVGVLVIEAGTKSGSLITSKLAGIMGRNVYAVPGPIDSLTSEGTNWLIKSGKAKLVTLASDILGYEECSYKQPRLFEESLTKYEKQVLDYLNREESNIDELSRNLGIKIPELSVIISSLLLRNLISEESGKIYLN